MGTSCWTTETTSTIGGDVGGALARVAHPTSIRTYVRLSTKTGADRTPDNDKYETINASLRSVPLDEGLRYLTSPINPSPTRARFHTNPSVLHGTAQTPLPPKRRSRRACLTRRAIPRFDGPYGVLERFLQNSLAYASEHDTEKTSLEVLTVAYYNQVDIGQTVGPTCEGIAVT